MSCRDEWLKLAVLDRHEVDAAIGGSSGDTAQAIRELLGRTHGSLM